MTYIHIKSTRLNHYLTAAGVRIMVKKILIICTIISSFLSCNSSNEITPPDEQIILPGTGERGFNTAKLNELINAIREGKDYPGIHSLLILRDSNLVVEEYFAGYNKNTLHTLQSVTKSVTSALIGIALEQGVIQSLDQKVLSFFMDLGTIENLDDRKNAMTLEDILTMRTGTDYNEQGQGSPHYQLNALLYGWDKFYLNRPMISEPGTRFQYDSGGVILLSSILKNLTGMHADEFADNYLFNHLGISNLRWYKNRENHPHTGGGLNLTPLDMAKFGLLFLNKGKWRGNQVIPAKWVEDSFKMHVTFGGGNQSYIKGYGYLWWILQPDPGGDQNQNIAAARGAYGQHIFVVPEHNIVVVVTANAVNPVDQNKPINFLYTHILPAVEK